MANAKIYIETTIPSYLTAWPSRDLVRAAHQQITREWWESAKSRFDLFVSEAVLEETSDGDPGAAIDRQAAVSELRVLDVDEKVIRLAGEYQKLLPLPGTAAMDIIHIACASSYQMDYLVTWNCRHIANPEVIRKLIRINDAARRETPLIVTPEALMEEML